MTANQLTCSRHVERLRAMATSAWPCVPVRSLSVPVLTCMFTLLVLSQATSRLLNRPNSRHPRLRRPPRLRRMPRSRERPSCESCRLKPDRCRTIRRCRPRRFGRCSMARRPTPTPRRMHLRRIPRFACVLGSLPRANRASRSSTSAARRSRFAKETRSTSRPAQGVCRS